MWCCSASTCSAGDAFCAAIVKRPARCVWLLCTGKLDTDEAIAFLTVFLANRPICFVVLQESKILPAKALTNYKNCATLGTRTATALYAFFI
jgi:hypothetical protein